MQYGRMLPLDSSKNRLNINGDSDNITDDMPASLDVKFRDVDIQSYGMIADFRFARSKGLTGGIRDC